MENYIGDVRKFFDLFPIPDAPAAGATAAEVAEHAVALAAVYAARARIAKSVVFQIAHGLKEFHDNKLLHKDLKPPNMLVRHDGRVMLTDYGLTIYNPAGVKQPVRSYYQATTLWYEPPEANSAGVAAGAATYKRGSSREAHDLLSHMLDLNPRTRYSADEVLAHPWFAGYTMREAARAMRNPMEVAGTNVAQTRKREVLAGARRTGQIGAETNTTPQEYISLLMEPAQGSYRNWTARQASGGADQINQSMFQILADWLCEISEHTRLNYPWSAYVHALELIDRYLTKKVIPRTKLQLYGVATMMLAGKAYAHQGLMIQADGPPGPLAHTSFYSAQTEDLRYMSSNAFTKEQIAAAELDIIKTLNGDIFPIADGIAEAIVGPIIGEVDDMARLQRVILATLFYIVWDGQRGSITDVMDLAKRVQTRIVGGSADPGDDDLGILAAVRDTQFLNKYSRDRPTIFRKLICHTRIFPARNLFGFFGVDEATLPISGRINTITASENLIRVMHPVRP
jgi:hypothetical protein